MTKIGIFKAVPGGKMGIVVFWFLILCISLPFVAQAQETRKKIVVPRRSAKIDFAHCASCHKLDGTGGISYNGGFAANFHETTLSHDEIVDVITNGRRDKGMPPWRAVFSKRTIDGLATYIETEFIGKP